VNKFQPFSFKTVYEFLASLPDDELKITETLRALVFECIPDVKEKLGYNVPFYSRHSRICFIWPGSIPWGKTTKQGVELGFCKGNLLADPSYLTIGNRKEVYIKTFHSIKEINQDVIRQLLYEAVIIDEKQPLLKKKTNFKNDSRLR
jgi:hypothetical protein